MAVETIGNMWLEWQAQKVLPITPKADVTLVVDMFNVFNDNTILLRNYDASGPVGTIGDILTIQNPRVLRFGARISF